MTSEIRTNSLKSRAGLSTVTLTDTGPMFSGITTFVDNSGFNIGTGSSIFSPAANTLTFGTNSNERVRIDSSGRMGLGTNNPEEILHVKAASETVNSRDGVIFQSSSSLAADTGLPLVFSSHIGNDPNYPVASIAGRKENASNGDGAGYLQLATGSSAGAISEKARITSGGLVGSGTNSPASRLAIHDTDGRNLTLSNSWSGETRIGFTGGNASANGYSNTSTAGALSVTASAPGGAATGYMSFYTNQGDNLQERLRIDSSGRLLVKEQVNASGTYGQYATLQLKGNSLNTNASIMLMANGKNTTANVSGDYLGYIIFGDKQAGEYAFIRGAVDAAPAVGDYPGRIEFHTTADGASGATERLRIDSNGTAILKNTGVATPRSDFFGSLRPISQIASTWNAYHSLTRHDAGSSYGPYLMLAKNRNDAYNSNGTVQDNDELGNISFLGNDGTAFREGARIRGEVDGTPGSSQVPSALTFATNAGSGVGEKLRITSDGKLLLGTTDSGFSGGYTIMTVGNTSLGDSGITIASSATGIGRLHFADGNSGSAVYAGWIAYNHNSNSMLFSTNGSGSEKVTINSDGRLSVVTAATQINFGNTIGKGGFLLSTTDGQFAISGGGYWGGSNWTATATASTQIRHDGGTGAMNFCLNTGLTAGNNFTPTTRMELTPSGNLKISDPTVTFSDSSPYFPVAWSGTDGYNTVFTIASTGYANLRFRGEQTTGTEFTMGVGGGQFYMAYDDISNSHRLTINSSGVVSGDLNDTSDEKLKKNITSLADGAIDRIKQLRPVNFDWKRETDLNGQSGFIAQEVKTVIPDLVVGEEYVENSIESVGYSVNTNGLVAHLTKAVQELITKVETLEQDNIALRARVTNLEGN